jgi:hypothetical protein
VRQHGLSGFAFLAQKCHQKMPLPLFRWPFARQSEFAQLDLDLSFTIQEAVMALVELIVHRSWPEDELVWHLPWHSQASIPEHLVRLKADEDLFSSVQPIMPKLLSFSPDFHRLNPEIVNFSPHIIIISKLALNKVLQHLFDSNFAYLSIGILEIDL